MDTATIREKLCEYIRVADEKKLQAIYTILVDEITEETEWWKDNAFIGELDNRYEAWQKGEEKAYTLNEVDAAIEQLKHKRIK